VNTDAAMQFRQSLGCFATGVTIVTAPSASGTPVGMTVSSFNSVSLDPPLILFSIGREARSLPDLVDAPAFAVNVLSADQIELSNRFARPSETKWDGIDHEVGLDGAPVFPDALACFECEPYAINDGGDHLVFLGRVMRHRAAPDAKPLVFYGGGYHTVVDAAVST
jgi:flavin reductase (DIM6/NTAB) family NADH-FMN oxidoreductase RutF